MVVVASHAILGLSAWQYPASPVATWQPTITVTDLAARRIHVSAIRTEGEGEDKGREVKGEINASHLRSAWQRQYARRP